MRKERTDHRDESSRLCFSFLICPLSHTLSPTGLASGAFRFLQLFFNSQTQLFVLSSNLGCFSWRDDVILLPHSSDVFCIFASVGNIFEGPMAEHFQREGSMEVSLVEMQRSPSVLHLGFSNSKTPPECMIKPETRRIVCEPPRLASRRHNRGQAMDAHSNGLSATARSEMPLRCPKGTWTFPKG